LCIPIVLYIEYQLLLYYSETSAKVVGGRDIGRLAADAVAERMSALFIIERVKPETKNDIHCLMNRSVPVVLYGITMRPQWSRLRWTKGVLLY